MANDPNGVDLSDLLHELAIDAEHPTPGFLSKLMKAHPEHAEVLAQFAEDLMLDGDPGAEVEDVPDELLYRQVSPAMSRYQNQLFEQRHGAAARPESGATAQGGDPFGWVKPKEFRALAGRVGANALFLTRVRNREIRPETIPKAFSERLAKELHVTVQAYLAQLAMQVQAPPGVSYRSETKPTAAPQITWDAAVRSSSLSQEQIDALLAL